jgi:hypothetical protein
MHLLFPHILPSLLTYYALLPSPIPATLLVTTTYTA